MFAWDRARGQARRGRPPYSFRRIDRNAEGCLPSKAKSCQRELNDQQERVTGRGRAIAQDNPGHFRSGGWESLSTLVKYMG